MILAPLLHEDNEDLLHEECKLNEQIPLHQAREGARRPLRPDGSKITPVVGILPEILQQTTVSYHTLEQYHIDQRTIPTPQMNE
jgi:hypothetical protein